MTTVAGPGLPAGGATYEFLLTGGSAETGLLKDTLFKSSGGTTVLALSRRAYEGDRDLIDSVTNTLGTTSSTDVISKYDYANDGRRRRQGVQYTGAAFSGSGHVDDWVYNARNEVRGTDRKAYNATIDAAQADETFDGTGEK